MDNVSTKEAKRRQTVRKWLAEGWNHYEIYRKLHMRVAEYDELLARMGLSRKRKGTKRHCMNPACRRQFLSQGPHHRFCRDCRQERMIPNDVPYSTTKSFFL